MKASDQGFVLALLGVAFVALIVAHVQLTSHPLSHAGAGCETCHTNIDQGVHPAITAHAFDRREVHRVFAACTDCHGGDASRHHFESAGHSRMFQGRALEVRCALCHSPRKLPSFAEGRTAWAKASCGSCHSDFRVAGERHAPPLDRAADKLTREWTYTYLLEPASYDPSAKSGTHGITGSDELRSQAKALALTIFVLDGARTRKSETWKAPLATRDPARFELLLGQCRGCHAVGSFATQGTKTNAPWLLDFLHTHLSASEADRAQLALGLAALYHPTFESRWPVMTRALDAELHTLAADQKVPDAGPAEAWMRPLGRALFVKEGCAFCHVKDGAVAGAPVPLTQSLQQFDPTHRALRDEGALRDYVKALLLWENERHVDLD